ncbi:MAG: hypothetical protein KDA21_05225 [Phycisphaerales bacterium]|nr:hypothetical protein [Phycisphaerales bacterium]
MRVLLLSDRSFSNREHRLLRRLKVGLLDEGVQVVHGIPAESLKNEPSDLTQVIAWDDRGRYFTRRGQAAWCVRELQRINLPESHQPTPGPIDVVEVWGDTAWPMVLEVAVQTEAVVLFHVWRSRSVGLVQKLERLAEQHHPDLRAVWVTPDQTTSEQVRTVSRRWPVRAIEWGVHAPATPRPFPRDDATLSACIMASGDDPEACCRCLEGIAPVVTGMQGEFLLFLDAAAVERHPRVWKAAESAGLLDRLSVVADVESRRDLVLRADLLLIPEVLRSHRSILLDAMATGMAVLTPETPDIDAINDDTALRLTSTAPGAWEEALRRLVDHRADADQLTRSAHAWVKGHRRVHEQVRRTLETYDAMFAQEPLEFPDLSAP